MTRDRSNPNAIWEHQRPSRWSRLSLPMRAMLTLSAMLCIIIVLMIVGGAIRTLLGGTS